MEKLTIPVVADSDRLGFSLRELCKEHGFDMSKGGAVHMWREVWDETVSEIYSSALSEYFFIMDPPIVASVLMNTLEIPEPLYGLPPKQDPYAEIKSRKKYGV